MNQENDTRKRKIPNYQNAIKIATKSDYYRM